MHTKDCTRISHSLHFRNCGRCGQKPCHGQSPMPITVFCDSATWGTWETDARFPIPHLRYYSIKPHLIWDSPRTERQRGLCRTARFKSWPLHNCTTTFSILRYALWEGGQGFPAISHSLEAGLAINSHIGWTRSWIRSLFCWLFETCFCQG